MQNLEFLHLFHYFLYIFKGYISLNIQRILLLIFRGVPAFTRNTQVRTRISRPYMEFVFEKKSL